MRANEGMKVDSAFSTTAKDENNRVREGKPTLDSKGKSFKTPVLRSSHRKGGGRLPLVEEMLHGDREISKSPSPSMPTVTMASKEIDGKKMVAPARRKRARESRCPLCGCSWRANTVSGTTSLSLPTPSGSWVSTVDSPSTLNLSASYGPDELSPVFAQLIKFYVHSSTASFCSTASSRAPDLPTFTLTVTAQAVPLPSRVSNPPVTLRLYFLELWPKKDRCYGREAAVAQFQSCAERLLSPLTALGDVHQLLTGSRDTPWVFMPITNFTVDVASRIERYLRGCGWSGFLGLNRIVCHLDVTAHYSKHR